ncbi:MAG: ABC transporter permease subunit [Clostridia bacterium]|nr:ABC transporter permease subunit [Clostridia bacterium]
MVKKFFTQQKINIICSVAAIIFMWLVWLIAYYSVGNKLIVPPFTEAVKSFWHYLGDGTFWLAVGNSFGRSLLAFAISFVLAAACAALAIFSSAFKAALKPIMVVIRTLPTMAVVLIILKVTLGDKTMSPVIVTVLVLLPMIYAQIIAEAEGIDGGIKQMACVYGISKKERLFKIYLPLISPSILSQTGANLSLGLKVLISAEVLVNTARGLGGMMQTSSAAAEVANLAALTLTAVILGLVVELAFSQLSRINRRWRVKEGTDA